SSVRRSAATPRPFSIFATFWTSASVRAATATRAPSAASASAIPSPMPRVAAVTSATRPSMPRSMARHASENVAVILPPGAINTGDPVVPRPSATVVLIRGSRPFELLLVRRPGGADFAPGAYVFPGGTVHADDRGAEDEIKAAAIRALSDPDITLVYATRSVLETIATGESATELFRRARAEPDVPIIEPRMTETESGWVVTR